MSDEQINQAIDRAVREIVDVEPPSDLRARVFARIEQPPAPGVRWARIVAPLAAAALVVFSLVLWLPSRHASQVESARNEPVHVPLSGNAGHVAVPAPERPRLNVARPEPARVARAERVPLPAATANEARAGSEVAPLDPIAPIRIAAVAPTDITPEAISIEPLAPIAQVQIAPLTPPDGRH